jgi:hypothetical protein
MSDRNPVLIGAEDVRSAGHTMARAAETMSSAAMNIHGALERHQNFLDDWLQRFEAAVETMTRGNIVVETITPDRDGRSG